MCDFITEDVIGDEFDYSYAKAFDYVNNQLESKFVRFKLNFMFVNSAKSLLIINI